MQFATKRLVALASASVLTLTLAGCSGSAAAGGGGSTDSATDCAQPGNTGITDTTIKVGETLPQSGAVAHYGGIGYGMQAYFDKINSEGGVKMGDGKTRTIELTTADDAYEPSQTVSKTQELLDQDGVFALVGSFGSATQLAITPLLEKDCVPSLWIGSANPLLQTPNNKWQLGSSVPASVETEVWVDYIKKNYPQAKIAILAQNGDLSKPYIDTLTSGLKGTDAQIVATQTYEPTDTDVRQQMTTLAASGADVLFMPATATPAKQALNHAHELGWAPAVLAAYTTTLDAANIQQVDPGAAANLTVVAQYRETEGPDASTPVVQDYIKWFTQAGGLNQYTLLDGKSGWHSAQLFVETLKQMPTADRQSLIKASHNLTVTDDTLVYPGIALKTSDPSDYVLQQGVALQKWNPATQQFDTADVINVGN